MLADLGHIDEAFKTARENFAGTEALGLLDSRSEGRRCLAHVHFKNGDLGEAVRLCDEALEILGDAKSRVTRLWMGPLHIEALFLSGRREEASQRLVEYEAVVADCQTPRCEREVERLKKLLDEPFSAFKKT